ncbi:adenine deaminase [Thermoflexibacter ruber]|uniref:Adenine deaminase n=1 Tax=Thermoflexibacter ruber TaxID=1003 RepID=A0A1I2JAA3_9BACT|nr:adenine deaminase [Thermoflexibacter ruber]SFF51725.1 Adenine deaminase [Thermoflexibacter ruber]
MTFIKANLVNIRQRSIKPAHIYIENGQIVNIKYVETFFNRFALPGFIDAHVHIESSMLIPSEFARLAVVHGTVATVSDPHEIANVCGVNGVKFMIENGKKVPFKFYFGAPSCVPATHFETAGAGISPAEVAQLFESENLKYLAEMMNYPGVLFKDKEVMEKLAIAKKYGKKIDGHAPALRGEQAKQYISEGISTDHECFTREEALEKLQYGMKIIIREGSAAKNFEALIDLLPEHYENMMFCSDDKHPDNLVEGHINELVRRAVARGIDVFKVLQAACLNPVEHYGLEVGQLGIGDPADFILVDNLEEFNVLRTYINGQLVAEKGKSFIKSVPEQAINNFDTSPKNHKDFEVPSSDFRKIRVIEALDGQLVSNELICDAKLGVLNFVNNGTEIVGAMSDTERDILKIAVVNRYQNVPPAVAFIKNFGLQRGAIASSVGHDSHNIIVVGVDDFAMSIAVNLLIEAKGGIAVVDRTKKKNYVLPLPVAGLMTTEDGYKVAKLYADIDKKAKALGSKLKSPFMTLSFMALLVIPDLKLSDKGLFSGKEFKFVDLFVE